MTAHAPLSRLILRSMEKDREKRYQTTEELIADFEAVEETLPTADRALSTRSATKRKTSASKKLTVELTPRKLLIPGVAEVEDARARLSALK